MPTIREDSILWYNVPGIFEQAGLAVPSWGNDYGSMNQRIQELVKILQQGLQLVMFTRDVDLGKAPSINRLIEVHQLYERVSSFVNTWAIPFDQKRFEPVHSSPEGAVWRVYPAPYFFVRNDFFKFLAQNVLNLCTELMQHTENHVSHDISTRVKDLCAAYLNRVYNDMATRFFGKTAADILTDGFKLADEDFAAYNPDDFETDPERLETVPLMTGVFTEDQIKPLRQGILITDLHDLKPYPNTLKGVYDELGPGDPVGAGGSTGTNRNSSNDPTTMN